MVTGINAARNALCALHAVKDGHDVYESCNHYMQNEKLLPSYNKHTGDHETRYSGKSTGTQKYGIWKKLD
jgi:hypothetical protein